GVGAGELCRWVRPGCGHVSSRHHPPGPRRRDVGARRIAPPPRRALRARSPWCAAGPDSVVAWEEYATFNPAAVVKDGKVYGLYRAEDASGEEQIGRHTSRLGLAESSDGLRLTRRAAPALSPDTADQRQ